MVDIVFPSETGQIGPSVEAVSDWSENIDVELPDDGFLSERESNLLQDLNRKIENVTYDSCDVCVEEQRRSDLECIGTFFVVFPRLTFQICHVVHCEMWPVLIGAVSLGEGSCRPCVDP